MKKFVVFSLLFCVAFCCLFVCQNTALAEQLPTYVVSSNRANIFAENTFDSEILAMLTHGEILDENSTYKLEFSSLTPTIYAGKDGNFYKVLFDEQEGYVFADFVVIKNTSINSIPNFNAQTNASCKVYGVEKDITLSKGHRVFLYEGFKKTKYTKIAFLYENEVMYGEILTEYVDPDGVNPIFISAIIVVLAVLGIVFAWLFMKNKKKKVKINKK